MPQTTQSDPKIVWMLSGVVEYRRQQYQAVPEEDSNSCDGCFLNDDSCAHFKNTVAAGLGVVGALCNGRIWKLVE